MDSILKTALKVFTTVIVAFIFYCINQLLMLGHHEIPHLELIAASIFLILLLTIQVIIWVYSVGAFETAVLKFGIYSIKFGFHEKKLANRILSELYNKNAVITLSFSCSLNDYQMILNDLINCKKTKRIYFTNIYRPLRLITSASQHRYSLSIKNAVKKEIHIISENKYKDWLDDSNAQLPVIEELAFRTDYPTTIKYVLERDIKDRMSGKLRIGDYAIFNDYILISFNPTQSDEERGELWISLGNLNSYNDIFKISNEDSYFMNKFDDIKTRHEQISQ